MTNDTAPYDLQVDLKETIALLDPKFFVWYNGEYVWRGEAGDEVVTEGLMEILSRLKSLGERL